jgi:hypothetical protein
LDSEYCKRTCSRRPANACTRRNARRRRTIYWKANATLNRRTKSSRCLSKAT